MQYSITSVCGGEKCQLIIDEPNENAALCHYNALLVRQPDHPHYADYTDWQLERLPVEAKLIAKGTTVYW